MILGVSAGEFTLLAAVIILAGVVTGVLAGLFEIGNTAIEHNRELGMRRLEPIDAVVVERGNLAVFARREAGQPRLPRMHHQRVTARMFDHASERIERLLGILIINADAAFDGDGNAHG